MELELSIEERDSGQVTVQRLPFQDRIVLGRGPESPVLLDGPLISREHIAFEPFDGRLSLVDLSSNGSWINGEQISGGRRYMLTEADRVQVPGYELRFTLLPSKNDAPRPVPAAGQPQPAPPSAVKQLTASITSTEMTVLVVFAMAVAVAIVFYRL